MELKTKQAKKKIKLIETESRKVAGCQELKKGEVCKEYTFQL